MLTEFRDFLLRGNIVELAVAFVMGLAFAAVVNSFVDDLIMPAIAMVIGKPDFSALTFTINDAVFRYGAFLTAAIQCLAIAAAVFFFVVKPVNALLSRLRSPAEEACRTRSAGIKSCSRRCERSPSCGDSAARFDFAAGCIRLVPRIRTPVEGALPAAFGLRLLGIEGRVALHLLHRPVALHPSGLLQCVLPDLPHGRPA
jgi:large conductance mechanosensitive channel